MRVAGGQGLKVTKFLPRSLMLLLVLAYWGVGFYPFLWIPLPGIYENVVEETTEGGLSFQSRGIAYTEAPPKWVNAAITDSAFELELKVLSYDASQGGPARIFTLSHDHFNRNLTVGQSAEDLIVRLRTPVTDANGTPEHVVQGVFRQLGPHRIVVRVSAKDIRIDVNKRQQLVSSLPSGALSNWDPKYRLALGNEFTFLRPWRGEVKEAVVRVHGEEFPYTFEELWTPERYVVDSETLQERASRFFSVPFSHVDPGDWIKNILGFVPFGFLLMLLRRNPVLPAVALAWCAALSLGIEIGQVFLLSRTPELEDFLLNILGGGLGVWAGGKVRPVIARREMAW